MTPHNQSIPQGFCQCGCGQSAPVATRNIRRLGILKGGPRKFVHGHGGRKYDDGETQSRRWYRRAKEKGVCPSCGSARDSKYISCKKCLAKYRKEPASRSCRGCGALVPLGSYYQWCDSCRMVSCRQCGKRFRYALIGRPARYCSLACQAVAQRKLVGPLAGNWRGGVDACNRSKRAKERARKECKAWRRAVFERDGYTCQKCGFKGRVKRPHRLHAHHIESFAKHTELRCDVSNGVTLCGPCHVDIHRKKLPELVLYQGGEEPP